MHKISLVISIIALMIGGLALFQVRNTSLNDDHSTPLKEHGADEFDVVFRMMKLQWLTNKLWFAGNARNSLLTEFYLHEIEEHMEEFAEAEVVYDGFQLSALMRAHGLAALDLAENRLKTDGFDNFQDIYSNLISGCNNCHSGTNHGFIQIAIPKHPVADNQIFE
jgi:predicted  nucleic acid-binding Zn ribbon protein